MASRLSNLLRQTPSWDKMRVSELVDLMSERTGLDKREIRRALQDLEDTSVYIRSSGSSDRGGLLGNRKPKQKSR